MAGLLNPPGRPPREQWWCINGQVIMEMLNRAADGENPDLLYLEAIANSVTEAQDGED